jgi:uncharacterized protein (TIGR00369 family)
MEDRVMNFSAEQIQTMIDPVFPGLLGMQVGEAAPERVVATLRVRADLCTVGGIVHGGAMMAFADTLGAIGTLLNLPAGKRTATTDSSTHFIAGAPQGAILSGECVALHRGRTTHVWQTTIRADSGKVCAVVTQTQIVLDA